VKRLLLVALLLALAGCGAGRADSTQSTGGAPLRGFGIDVDQAVSARVPQVHLKTCGGWGCAEQDVWLSIAGPTSMAPCSRPSAGADAATCGPVHLPGPGPGYGYAPLPELTIDPVTVTVTTPPGAPLPIAAEVRVRPRLVCPNDGVERGSTCAGGAPQAQLRVAADGSVSQTA
jgi:hypothetical protein